MDQHDSNANRPTTNTIMPLALFGGTLVIAAAIFFGLKSGDQGQTPTDRGALPLMEQRGQPIQESTYPSLNLLTAYVEDCNVLLMSVEEAFLADDFGDISEHATDIEFLAQTIRQTAAELSATDFRLISRDVSELQHAAEELGHSAEARDHEEAHHAANEVKRYLGILEKDIEELQG